MADTQGLEFGFVPKNVIADLQDIGNWKSRATAIDSLQRTLKDVKDKTQLLPGLSQFIKFLMTLVADPNFKIAISSMTIIGDLVTKVGKDIEPYLRSIIPCLIEKFTDSKILVRSANMKVLRKLMQTTSAKAVLEHLSGGVVHTSWRVREEVINTHILAMLQFGRETYDGTRTFRLLLEAMSDTKDRIRLVALEGMAVLSQKAGSYEFQNLMNKSNTQDDLRKQIKERISTPAIASINADGMVEHAVDLPAGDTEAMLGVLRPTDLYNRTSSLPLDSKMPWETPNNRPRLRSPRGSDNMSRSSSDGVGPSDPLWNPSFNGSSQYGGITAPHLNRLGAGSYPNGQYLTSLYNEPNGDIRSASPLGRRDSAANPPSSSNGGSHVNGGLQALKQHTWAAANGRATDGGISAYRNPPTTSSDESPVSPVRGFLNIFSSRNSAPKPAPPTSTNNPGMHLWLQTNLEPDNPGNGRQETFSPSKAEMLANLKRRQNEKRVATSQGSTRPDAADSPQTPDDKPRQRLLPNIDDRPLPKPNSNMYHPGMEGSNESTPSPATAPGISRAKQAGLSAGRLNRASSAMPSPLALESPPQRMQKAATYSAMHSPGQSSPGDDHLKKAHSATVPSTPANGLGGSLFDKPANKLVELTSEELTPLPDPEKTVKVMIAKLIECNNAARLQLDWQGQHEALNEARRLVKFHPEVVKANLHDFVRAAVPAVDQLRSSTVKNGITLFSEMFLQLGKVVDRELDDIVPALLKKAGEISTAGRENFLAQEADKALADMYRTVTETRAVTSLVACAGHKNPPTRAKVASHLDGLMECAPNARSALLANWAVLEKLFKAGVNFLDEGALDTRVYGKRIIWHVKQTISNKADFDRLVYALPAATQKKVTEVVEGLNGPPPPPSRAVMGSRLASRQLSSGAPSPARVRLDISAGSSLSGLNTAPASVNRSAGGYSAPALHSGASTAPVAATPERRLPLGRQRSVRENSAEGNTRNPTPLRNGSVGGIARTSSGGGGGALVRHGSICDHFNATMQDNLTKAVSQLSAKDFRERTDGLKAIDGMITPLATAPDAALVALLDGMVQRLNDANSKVNIQALETLGRIFDSIRERVSLGLNTIVPALAANLGSTNDKIRSVAVQVADQLLHSVDPALLVQNFSHCVSMGHLRGKPMVVEKLVTIIHALYPTKPQLVIKYAVPAAFSLVNDSKGDTKSASQQLLAVLAGLMGHALVAQATSLSPANQQKVADAVAAATGRH